MIPPKRFDISPLTGECSEGLDAFIFFFNKPPNFNIQSLVPYSITLLRMLPDFFRLFTFSVQQTTS